MITVKHASVTARNAIAIGHATPAILVKVVFRVTHLNINVVWPVSNFYKLTRGLFLFFKNYPRFSKKSFSSSERFLPKVLNTTLSK